MHKIVVLQNGWIVTGKFSTQAGLYRLTDAAVVRRWGTTRGLGELAINGPTPSTVLDSCPDVQFWSYIMVMDCKTENWTL
jgi:hypothetical protein